MYLKYCLENLLFGEASILTPNANDSSTISDPDESEISEHRKTSVSFLDDERNFINQRVYSFIRQANDEFFHYDLSYSQDVQFAKYEKGDYYKWHQDSTFNSNSETMRKLSLTISLSDHESYDGGHLEFFNGGIRNLYHPEIEKDIKSVGSVVVFDSYDWHRVTPVTRGVRYSLVCWTVGPNFV